MERRVQKILEEVKKEISPDKGVIKDADEIVSKINSLLKKYKMEAVCVKGGSIAKETFLKDDYDVDLFIRFNPSYKNKDISELTQTIIEDLCNNLKTKFQRVHGSRDYFQFNIQKKKKIVMFEVIPVILVRSQNYKDAQNITDLSPEHVTWVKRFTDKNANLPGEIRLAKRFCKANKVYGAESYINGFSGHILDILVIHYGSFYKMIEAFSKLDAKKIQKPIVIDPEKNMQNPLKQLNKSKISPLIIIDPIQSDRNSAAALGKEKLLMFIDAAKNFVAKPSKKFFDIEPYDIKKNIKDSLNRLKISPKEATIILIEMQTHDTSKDIAGTKALKAYETIVEHLKLEGFKVLDSSWNFEAEQSFAEAYIITSDQVSKDVLLQGPPIASSEDYQKFVSKHEKLKHKIIKKDSRVYAQAPRKYVSAKHFVSDIVQQEFISRRVRGIFVR